MLARQAGQRALSLNAQWARFGAALDCGSQLPWMLVDKKDEKSASPSLPRGLSTLGSKPRLFTPATSMPLQHFLSRSMSSSSDKVVKVRLHHPWRATSCCRVGAMCLCCQVGAYRHVQ
jgi:hypothetical protein